MNTMSYYSVHILDRFLIIVSHKTLDFNFFRKTYFYFIIDCLFLLFEPYKLFVRVLNSNMNVYMYIY
jgi:hypothetical protein